MRREANTARIRPCPEQRVCAVEERNSPMKSIFVPLQGFARDAEALGAAYVIARLFDGHLDCLHVRQDPRLLVAGTTAGMETGLGTGVFPEQLWAVLVEADQRRAREARLQFETFCKRTGVQKSTGTGGVDAAYRETEGDVTKDITLNARYSDLVVFAHDALADEGSWDPQGDVV